MKNPNDLVKEPLPYTFKPLKTFLPKFSPRGQPIEQREFKTCTSKIPDTKLLRY
jgi:hypothetical protein